MIVTVYQDPHLDPEVEAHGGHDVMGELVISVAEEQRGLAHPGISHHQHLQVNQVVWFWDENGDTETSDNDSKASHFPLSWNYWLNPNSFHPFLKF